MWFLADSKFEQLRKTHFQDTDRPGIYAGWLRFRVVVWEIVCTNPHVQSRFRQTCWGKIFEEASQIFGDLRSKRLPVHDVKSSEHFIWFHDCRYYFFGPAMPGGSYGVSVLRQHICKYIVCARAIGHAPHWGKMATVRQTRTTPP